MRTVQIALLSAILIVLSVIAFQLTRLAADFQLGADLRAAIVSASRQTSTAAPAATETRAQRIEREAREAVKARREITDAFQDQKAVNARVHQLEQERAERSR